MKHVPFFVLVLAAFTDASVEEDEPPEVAGSPEVAVPADIAGSPDVEVPPDIAAFVQRLDSLRNAADTPGLSVVVLKDGALVLALGLGFSDLERRTPATAETPRAASSRPSSTWPGSTSRWTGAYSSRPSHGPP